MLRAMISQPPSVAGLTGGSRIARHPSILRLTLHTNDPTPRTPARSQHHHHHHPADKWGPQPAATWVPSDSKPCPGECLNLTYFDFIDSRFEDTCVCDYAVLKRAQHEFDEAFKWVWPDRL